MPSESVLVIPAYNEAKNLEKLLPQLEDLRPRVDIVFINDGSSDSTKEILEKNGFRVISHPVNRGYVAVVDTGLNYAFEKRYEICAFMDSDGQHDPAYVMPAIAHLKKTRSDLVIGSRFLEDTHYQVNLARRAGILFFRTVAYFLTRQLIYDTTSGFKVYNRRAVTLAVEKPLGGYDAELIVYLLRQGLSISEMPVKVHGRGFGKSMYTWKHSVIYPAKTLWAIGRVLMK